LGLSADELISVDKFTERLVNARKSDSNKNGFDEYLMMDKNDDRHVQQLQAKLVQLTLENKKLLACLHELNISVNGDDQSSLDKILEVSFYNCLFIVKTVFLSES